MRPALSWLEDKHFVLRAIFTDMLIYHESHHKMLLRGGCINDLGNLDARLPLPDGRGSVTTCKHATPKPSRDRKGAVVAVEIRQFPRSFKHSIAADSKTVCPAVLLEVEFQPKLYLAGGAVRT